MAVLRRLSGASGPAVRMKVDIKSFYPEVKASKSVKRFQRYSHFKARVKLEKFVQCDLAYFGPRCSIF